MIKRTDLKPIVFLEHPVYDVALGRAPIYEITSNDRGFIDNKQFSMHEYCYCVFEKMIRLDKSQLKSFLTYQRTLMTNARSWVDTVEELIELNIGLLTGVQQLKFNKILLMLCLMQDELDATEFTAPDRFNFTNVKATLHSLGTWNEKLIFLHELKADYLQNKPRFVDSSEVCFEKKIAIEIEKVENLARLVDGAASRGATPKPEVKIDNDTFIKIMNINDRTAATWRKDGIIGYSQIGSKFYYYQSDIDKVLEERYTKANAKREAKRAR